MRIVAVVAVLAFASAARADLPDPDTEVARRRFAHGAEFYEEGKYAEAAGEFEAANRVRPSPLFDFNIGRCYDRLERWREAADAYERYLASGPADADEIRTRVAVLRARVVQDGPAQLLPPTPPAQAPQPVQRPAIVPEEEAPDELPAPPRTPIARRWWLWTIVGGAVAAGVGVGVGVGVTQGGERFPPTTRGVFDVRWP